jgi:hypothetical protein
MADNVNERNLIILDRLRGAPINTAPVADDSCDPNVSQSATVTEFQPRTYDGRPDLLLKDAANADLARVIVIGTTKDGEPWEAATTGDLQANWDVDQFKLRLITP